MEVDQEQQFELTLLGIPNETQVVLNYSDSILDLLELITPTIPFHGSYGLTPVVFVENSWTALTDQVLGIYSDLTLFADLPEHKENKKGLRITKIPYTSNTIAAHIIRLRDIIYSSTSSLAKSGTYDPTSIAISAGVSNYATVRGPSVVPQPDQVFSTPFDNWTLDSINPTASLQALHKATVAAASPISIRSISVSPWSPPPHAQKLRGHLVYLVISTIEGETFQITGTTAGFYISKSGNAHFDPSPKILLPKNVKSTPYHSLFDLLTVLSPSFAAFSQASEAKRTAAEVEGEIYSTLEITHAVPSASWIVPTPIPTSDPLRTQLAYLITGTTNADLLPSARDWQDELTQFKELPIEPVDAQILRERLVSRVSAAFTHAATLGVQAIVRGDIQPLNPNEPSATHTYIHNCMLFTKAEDAIGAFTHLGGNAAAFAAAAKDLRGVGLLQNLDIAELNSCENVVVDFAGRRWVAQSIIPGLFKNREEPEVGAVVEGAEVKEGEETIPSPAVVFEIIYGSSSPENPGSVLKTDKYFDSLAKKVATGLHFAEHSAFDGEGTENRSVFNSDVHGVKGNDGKCWILDCGRLHCTDVNFLESHANATATLPAYPHRMLLLRSELLEAYHSSKLQSWIEEKVTADKATRAAAALVATENGDSVMTVPEGEKEKLIIDAGDFKLSFNPSAFTERAPVDGKSIPTFDPEEESSKEVRNVANWLIEHQIPTFIVEVISNSNGSLDGFYLTELLHRNGINMRYLGIILAMVEKDGETYDFGKNTGTFELKLELSYLQHSLKSAMVARACKHILRSLTKSAQAIDYSNIISHFFNCLLGAGLESSPTPVVNPTFENEIVDQSWTELTPSIVQEMVVKEVETRFRYTLSPDYLVKSIQPEILLREICIRFGIQLQLKEYHFIKTAATSSTTETVATKKGKKSITKIQDLAQTLTFKPDDILNIYPISKYNIRKPSLADDLFDLGRSALLQGAIDQGSESISTALAMYEQIFGAVHPILATKFHSLGLAYHSLFQRLSQRIQFHDTATRVLADMPESPEKAANLESLQDRLLTDVEGARVEQSNYLSSSINMIRQSIIVSERTIGLDSHATCQSYTDLAVLELSIGNPMAALRISKHAINLWASLHGARHPAILKALVNVSTAIQSMSPDISDSIPILLETQTLASSIYGEVSIPYANSCYSLSQAYGLSSKFKTALVYASQAHSIFTQLSSTSPDLSETLTDIEAFTKAIETAILRIEERTDLEIQSQTKVESKPLAPLYKGGRVLPTTRKAPTVEELDSMVNFINGSKEKESVGKGKGKATRKRKPSSPST